MDSALMDSELMDSELMDSELMDSELMDSVSTLFYRKTFCTWTFRRKTGSWGLVRLFKRYARRMVKERIGVGHGYGRCVL